MCVMDVSLLHREFNVAGHSLLMGFLWKGCFMALQNGRRGVKLKIGGSVTIILPFARRNQIAPNYCRACVQCAAYGTSFHFLTQDYFPYGVKYCASQLLFDVFSGHICVLLG